MVQHRTIIHQYCPILSKNVAIEKTIDMDNNEQYNCLNNYQCNCSNGTCQNKLVTAYNIKIQQNFY